MLETLSRETRAPTCYQDVLGLAGKHQQQAQGTETALVSPFSRMGAGRGSRSWSFQLGPLARLEDGSELECMSPGKLTVSKGG